MPPRLITQMQERLGTAIHYPRILLPGPLQAYQQSLSTEPILVITALLAVYIVLGILYESLVHPLTIISTLPSASVGAIWRSCSSTPTSTSSRSSASSC